MNPIELLFFFHVPVYLSDRPFIDIFDIHPTEWIILALFLTIKSELFSNGVFIENMNAFNGFPHGPVLVLDVILVHN